MIWRDWEDCNIGRVGETWLGRTLSDVYLEKWIMQSDRRIMIAVMTVMGSDLVLSLCCSTLDCHLSDRRSHHFISPLDSTRLHTDRNGRSHSGAQIYNKTSVIKFTIIHRWSYSSHHFWWETQDSPDLARCSVRFEVCNFPIPVSSVYHVEFPEHLLRNIYISCPAPPLGDTRPHKHLANQQTNICSVLPQVYNRD